MAAHVARTRRRSSVPLTDPFKPAPTSTQNIRGSSFHLKIAHSFNEPRGVATGTDAKCSTLTLNILLTDAGGRKLEIDLKPPEKKFRVAQSRTAVYRIRWTKFNETSGQMKETRHVDIRQRCVGGGPEFR